MVWLRLIVTLLFSISCFGAPKATSTPLSDTKYEKVTVGVILSENYTFYDENGILRGFPVDVAYEIGQRAELEVSFKVFETPGEATTALQDNEISMVVDYAKTAEREANFIFSDYSLMYQSITAYVVSGSNILYNGETSQLQGLKFGILKGAVTIEKFLAWCDERDFIPNLTQYNSSATLDQAITAGEVDVGIVGNYAPHGFATLFHFSPTYSYIMFNKDGQAIKAKVDYAIANIVADNPTMFENIYFKYLGTTDSGEHYSSAAEVAYLELHPILKVAVIKDDEPFFHLDRAGNPDGIIPAYYDYLAKKLGITFKYVTYASQTDVINAVKNGDADIVGIYGNDIVDATNQGLLKTNSYTDLSGAMITRAGYDGTVNTAAVVQRRLQMVASSLNDKSINLIAYTNNDACYQALMEGKVDAIYSSIAVATWQINQHSSQRLSITSVGWLQFPVSGAVAVGNNDLLNILNDVTMGTEDELQSAIANETVADDTLLTLFARLPVAWTVTYFAITVIIGFLLIIAIILLVRRQKEKNALLTTKAQNEREEIRLNEMMKSTDERNQFFANISHDMRTPLNAIIGFADLAEHEENSPLVKDYLSRIHSSGELLLNLINDSLTISKINSGKLILNNEVFNNRQMVEQIVTAIRPMAESKHITFIVDDTNCPARDLIGDQLNLQKIILNLLTNAVKYTPEGGTVKFIYALDRNTKETVITISDTGIGMSPEFLPHLYEPFVQEQRKGYESTGTGLGLSIVKNLVKLMNGTMSVQSRINEGTTFTIWLRFKEAPHQQKHEKVDVIETEVSKLKGKHILLCEDNELNRMIAMALLQSKEILVDTANNGAEGLAKFAESKENYYDVILMDLRMPVMGGIEAATKIRALHREDAKRIPIIAMTADVFEDDVRRCLMAGMNAHISKPLNPQNVYDTIFQEINKKEA